MISRHHYSPFAKIGVLLLCFYSSAFAAPLKENNAYIEQAINIPGGMNIAINPGGSGCNAANNEKWEPSENGCSNIEWVKKTARVISVTASPASILANNVAISTLTANVVDGKGSPVRAGIPTSWGTTNGSLSSTSTVTNASGKAAVTLRGTVARIASVTAAAVAGASSTNVTLLADPSTSRVVTLVASVSSLPADGTAAGLFATVRDAYNNILPAGQAVYWSATVGTLNSGVSYTDASGVASASISSGVAGNSEIYARTAVSANANTSVTFTSAAPVITKFTEHGIGKPNFSTPNLMYFDGYDRKFGANMGLFYNVFAWEATGADYYQIIAPAGEIVWTGTANRWQTNDYYNSPDWVRGVKDGNSYHWRLRAFKGSNYVDSLLLIRNEDRGCWSCGS